MRAGTFRGVIILAMGLVCSCIVAAVPLCLTGDFDSQVHQLLSSQLLTKKEVANLSAVFRDVEETLRSRWPGSEVIPLGSVITRLTMKSSDADCMVKVPNYNIYNSTASRHLILEAIQLLNKQPELYANVRAKFRPNHKIDLLKFTYVPTQRDCDLSFINTYALMSSRMVADYYSFDDRIFVLAAILKFWSKVHKRNRKSGFTGYILNLLIIFYLQQENIVPPFYLLRKMQQQHLVNDFSNTCHNSKNVYQLLGGFFEYYSEFNFDEYVVSPLIGRPMHKKEFDDVDNLPEELFLYKTYYNVPTGTGIQLNTRMCIQDAIFQHVNMVEDTRSDDIISFIWHIRSAARTFRHVAKDDFLRAILIKGKDGNTFELNSTADDVQELKDCGF